MRAGRRYPYADVNVLMLLGAALGVAFLHCSSANPDPRCNCARQDAFMARAIECEVRESARDNDRGDLADGLPGRER